MCETTIHANSDCSGKLTHELRKSFFKPTLVLQCSAHGKGSNIGYMKSINLTRTITLKYKTKELQCSVAAVKLSGSAFQSGLSMNSYTRAVRQSGLKISNEKMKAVVESYSKAVNKEYAEQQTYINSAYISKQDTCVAIDTSFSQNRNAHYSQTAGLEDKSGEIVKMIVLDKYVEKCSSSKLDAIGVERLIDQSFEAGVPFAVVSTDECSEVAPMLHRKATIQKDKFHLDMIIQNDPYHKLKNSRTARKARFEDPKFESQKILTRL